MNKNQKITKAVKIVGSQHKLAKKCEVEQPTVYKWINGVEYSAKYAYRIEKATGGKVTARELCEELHKLDRKKKREAKLAQQQTKE